MNKYAVAAFIAFGALLGVSAQAAPASPAFVQTQAASGDAALQKVWYYGHGGYYRHYRPYYGYGGYYRHYRPYYGYGGYYRPYYGYGGYYRPYYGFYRHRHYGYGYRW
jgi:hypothetical protein